MLIKRGGLEDDSGFGEILLVDVVAKENGEVLCGGCCTLAGFVKLKNGGGCSWVSCASLNPAEGVMPSVCCRKGKLAGAKPLLVSLLALERIEGGASRVGGAGVPFAADGKPNSVEGFGLLRTEEVPTVVVLVDGGWRKLNFGAVVGGVDPARIEELLLLPPKEVNALIAGLEDPKGLDSADVSKIFSEGLVEGVLDVVGNVKGFAGGVNVVGGPKVVCCDLVSRVGAKGFGFINGVDAVMERIDWGLAPSVGSSSSSE